MVDSMLEEDSILMADIGNFDIADSCHTYKSGNPAPLG